MFLCGPPMTMRRVTLSFMLLTLYTQLSSSSTALSSDTNYHGIITCFDDEREALLRFKAGLLDLGNQRRLSSWNVEPNCCLWEGVECDNSTTGHVIKLDLHNPQPFIIDPWGNPETRNNSGSLGGKITPSLLSLKYLVHLDLSGNNFNYTPIPKFIGSFKDLRYLNLSNALFGGTIPTSFANLTKLRVLDLSSDDFSLLEMHDAKWLFQLHALEDLDMSNVKIFADQWWVHALNSLPSIAKISLKGCQLTTLPHTLHHINFTSLSLFDLGGNNINSTMLSWLFNITSLQHLDLSSNQFHGHVPNSIGKMTSLHFLDLSSNYDLHMSPDILLELKNLCKLQSLNLAHMNIKHRFSDLGVIFSGCMKDSLQELWLYENTLTGQFPSWIGNLTRLRCLDLSSNSLYGPLPQSLWQLSALQQLVLGYNAFNGTVTEAHFHDLTRLEFLHISSNQLVLNVSINWVPPFQLKYLGMSGCPLGPAFPAWLRTQKTLVHLSLSQAGISDTLPTWFWDMTSTISNLDLSGNGMKGKLPTSLEFAVFADLNLGSNFFEGPIPNSILNVQELDLSNNSLAGTLPSKIIETIPMLEYIILSNNKINGTIPSTLCELEDLAYLDLSNNSLSGIIPTCFKNNSNLAFLDFSINHLSGHVPAPIFLLPALSVLSLSRNNLSGYIPFCTMKCERLYFLDLGHNMLTGSIPASLGESLMQLEVLILRSNNFDGNIPPQLSFLTFLHILDLSDNHLSGVIPKSFGKFKNMISNTINESFVNYWSTDVFVTTKGLTLEYILGLYSPMSIIDLSENDLYGCIPHEIGNLKLLHSLNLSGNYLTGEIPDKIGSMSQLESLDLSRNQLSGAIPAALSKLSFLEVLNLSNNHLSGEIPTGGQFNTFFNTSIYMNNDNLCGFPLSKKCHDNSVPEERSLKDEIDSDHDSDTIWFYFGIISGFVVGLWTVWVIFLLKNSWKIAYFLFFDRMSDRVYIAFAVKFAKIKRWYMVTEDE